MHDALPTVPRSLIAFAPFGVGLMCALFYIEKDLDIYGWWIGNRDTEYESAYFKLEDYFTRKPTQFYATEGDDLYAGWRYLYSAKDPVFDDPQPMEQQIAHELDRLQGIFVAEWLFFDHAVDQASEREAYDRMGFPVRYVNLRIDRLNHLDRDQPVWIYRSHDFDGGVLDYLARFWPLDYGKP
jgi:hypothetical protein